MTRRTFDLAPYRTDISGFAEAALGIVPHPGQRRIFELVEARDTSAPWRARYADIVVTAGNRAGKTTALAIIVLWHLVYRIGLRPPEDATPEAMLRWLSLPYRWYHVSYESKVAHLLFDEAEKIMRGVHPAQRRGCPLTKAYGPIIDFDDRYLGDYPYARVNRLFGGAELHIRHTDERARSLLGVDMHGISFDEAGFEMHLRDVRNEVLHLRRLSTGGPIIWIGTPSTGFGQFYDLVRELEASPTAAVTTLSTRENIGYGIDPEVFESLLTEIPPHLVPQNIDGQFVAEPEAYFEPSSVHDAFRESAAAPCAGHTDRYVVGLDPALIADDAVISVVRRCPDTRRLTLVHCQVMRGEKSLLSVVDATTRAYERAYAIDRAATLVLDATALGGRAFSESFQHIPSRVPYEMTTAAKKREVLASLRVVLDERRLIIPPEIEVREELRSQLRGYKLDDRKIRTDMVISLALAVWYFERGGVMRRIGRSAFDYFAT